MGLFDDDHQNEDIPVQLLDLCEKSGYDITQSNGQRIYFIPSSWKMSTPPKGSEVFIGHLPKQILEYDIIPLFEKIGKLYNFRLMLDFYGCSRGYAFATYFNPDDAQRAVEALNGYQIHENAFIGVYKSVDNCRLFIGNIPFEKTKYEVFEMVKEYCVGVTDVIMFFDQDDPRMNRGFAFVEFENHRLAAVARRQFTPHNLKVWGRSLHIDWAEPLPEVNPVEMATVS